MSETERAREALEAAAKRMRRAIASGLAAILEVEESEAVLAALRAALGATATEPTRLPPPTRAVLDLLRRWKAEIDEFIANTAAVPVAPSEPQERIMPPLPVSKQWLTLGDYKPKKAPSEEENG